MQTVPVRRVRDDVPSDRIRIPEEIDAGEPVFVVSKVAWNDDVSGLPEFGHDGSVAACRFPDIAPELDMGEQGTGRGRMGRVVVEPGALVPVRVRLAFSGGGGEFLRIHNRGGEEIRALKPRPKGPGRQRRNPQGANP